MKTKFLGNFVGYVSNRFDIMTLIFDLEPGVAIRKKVSEGDGKAPLLERCKPN